MSDNSSLPSIDEHLQTLHHLLKATEGVVVNRVPGVEFEPGTEMWLAELRAELTLLEQRNRALPAQTGLNPPTMDEVEVLFERFRKGPSRSQGGEFNGVVRLTPAFLEQARQEFTEEEYCVGIREIRETGGLELSDFIHELEEAAGLHE